MRGFDWLHKKRLNLEHEGVYFSIVTIPFAKIAEYQGT